MSNMLF